jgi:hypothetical protein
MKLTLRKTIPSSSHNAPYSEELGEHWPQGQQFRLLSKKRQDDCRKFYRFKDTSTIVEQIGGEEVLVAIPNDKFVELFGIESPYQEKDKSKLSNSNEQAPTSSPWGQVQHSKQLAEGIWSVSTESHGGIWLSDERLAELTEILGYQYPTFSGDSHWFEEDCDWVVPVAAFRIEAHYETACKQLRMMRQWIDKHIYKRAYNALVASGKVLDHEKVKVATDKFFNDRHDARVAAGRQSLFTYGD